MCAHQSENFVVYIGVIGVHFFFSSRRRHTRYWRDWSSDVCSSDLDGAPVTGRRRQPVCPCAVAPWDTPRPDTVGVSLKPLAVAGPACVDRESAGQGKSVGVGGGRII